MKTTDYRKYLERKVQEETGGELGDYKLGVSSWKDWLYVIPPVVLLAYLIIRSVL